MIFGSLRSPFACETQKARNKCGAVFFGAPGRLRLQVTGGAYAPLLYPPTVGEWFLARCARPFLAKLKERERMQYFMIKNSYVAVLAFMGHPVAELGTWSRVPLFRPRYRCIFCRWFHIRPCLSFHTVTSSPMHPFGTVFLGHPVDWASYPKTKKWCSRFSDKECMFQI